MKITERKVTIRELSEGYIENKDTNEVWGLGNKLNIRPSYQREFVYDTQKRNAVIDSVYNNLPISVMYWNKIDDDKYEVLDGQQRTISICQYVNSDFSMQIDGIDKFFHNLSVEAQNRIYDYEITVYVCEGTEDELLKWFRVINIAGEVLTEQELLNATYTGAWLSDAKMHFSRRNCPAKNISEGYVKGNTLRQEYLETAIKWIANRDNIKGKDGIQQYMAIHQHDDDADAMWQYFQRVISWAKSLFPNIRKGITDKQEWGILYNKYHNNDYNSNELERTFRELQSDDDVTKPSGIIEYLLSARTRNDEKYLSLRQFTVNQKSRAYEKQNHRCAMCMANGIDIEYAIEDMQADHIIPWSKGGKTTDDNLQLLCRKCNNDKRDK